MTEAKEVKYVNGFFEDDGYGDFIYDYAVCPVCGHQIECGSVEEGSECCSDCGQALAWFQEKYLCK